MGRPGEEREKVGVGKGVGQNRRREGKKSNRNEKVERKKGGKEIIKKEGIRLGKVHKNSMTRENLKRKSFFSKSKRVASMRVEAKFGHCDYIDLVEVGARDDSNCAPGGKFLFKVN